MLELITFYASLAISPCFSQFLFFIYGLWVGRDARSAWFQSFITFGRGQNMLRTRSLTVANKLIKGTTKRYFWGLGIFFPIRGFCRPIFRNSYFSISWDICRIRKHNRQKCTYSNLLIRIYFVIRRFIETMEMGSADWVAAASAKVEIGRSRFLRM